LDEKRPLLGLILTTPAGMMPRLFNLLTLLFAVLFAATLGVWVASAFGVGYAAFALPQGRLWQMTGM
jgi:hypothetical protein